MTRSGYMLLMFATGKLNEEALSREEKRIKRLLFKLDQPHFFCNAFELVDRNCITRRRSKILKAAQHYRLKPFRFFINKN